MGLIDWSRAAMLTTTEFEVSWELLGLGETPWQLDPPRSGPTAPERRAIVESVVVDLQRRGLGDPRGPRPELADQLRLLARPERSVDVRFRRDSLVAGVAACGGSRAALAVRHRDEIAVLAVHPASASAAVLELLGPIEPGPGHDVHLPETVLDAVRTADLAGFADELTRLGVARSDADDVAAMCRGPLMQGQVGASAATGDGRRIRRAPYVIGVHHTPSGHYRQVRRGGLVTVGPTSHRHLLDELDELTRR